MKDMRAGMRSLGVRSAFPIALAAVAALAAFASSPALAAQDSNAGATHDPEVLAVLEAHRLAFTVEEDGLHGEGAAWLVERAGQARFTLIGESHLNAETPRLTAALLRALRPAGYTTYVVETGPESTRLLVEALRSEGVPAAEALLTELPFAMPFLDRREELAAVADALALGYDVWGIDQEFIGSPRLLFRRLAELAPDAPARKLVRELNERETGAFQRFASSGDPSRAFLMTGTAEDFDALSAAFPDPESEGGRIVQQLRASSRVYRAFAEERYYDNNATRVALIKTNYLDHVRRADVAPVSERKALIKMGSVHAGRGRTPMHVYDIGNFAAELAFAGGGRSFHLLVLAAESVGEDGTLRDWRARSPYLAPAFDLVGDDGPVVFDLAPLRPLLTQRGEKTPELEELLEVALRYDALVLFPRFHPAEALVPLPAEIGGSSRR